MDSKNYTCFVCLNHYPENEVGINQNVYLKVCKTCQGTELEKQKEQELLEGLAEGFVCGCI